MNRTQAIQFDIIAAFAATEGPPPTTLRAGNALDNCERPPAFEAQVDRVTGQYLAEFRWGLPHLDAESWRHYLPYLLLHALSDDPAASDVADALLGTLRPPAQDRFSTLTPAQTSVVIDVLDHFAFSGNSSHADDARTALEEWWAPGSIYGPR